MSGKIYHRVMWDSNNPYAYRNDNLRKLGFKSYRAYLRSPLWSAIRARVFARDKGKCARCKHFADRPQIHHRAYDPATLRGDNIDALLCVCDRCHRNAERPDDYTRSSHDRLHEASTTLMKPKRRRHQWRRPKYEDSEYAPIWARALAPPKLVQPTGPRKRSEQRPRR